MSNLRQRKRVEELPKQQETRLAADRGSKKGRHIDLLQKQRVYNRLAFKYCPCDDYRFIQDIQTGLCLKLVSIARP